jgi:hypothetical protein
MNAFEAIQHPLDGFSLTGTLGNLDRTGRARRPTNDVEFAIRVLQASDSGFCPMLEHTTEKGNWRAALVLGLALYLTRVLSAQGLPAVQNPPDKMLVVNGKTVEAKVRQIDGRSYVDVEALAQATGGTVIVEPNRVVLTIPIQGSSAPDGAALAQATQGLSRSFASAATTEVAEMREWRG